MAGVFAVVVGIPSMSIALALALMVISAYGPHYDVLMMNDVVVSGAASSATIVLFCLAIPFGALAIFSFVRLRKRFDQWRNC